MLAVVGDIGIDFASTGNILESVKNSFKASRRKEKEEKHIQIYLKRFATYSFSNERQKLNHV